MSLYGNNNLATCLQACGIISIAKSRNKIALVSRLGGVQLGFLDLPDKSLSAFKQVRRLQQQASLLCPHPTRTFEDVLLFVGLLPVGPPDLAYLDDFDEQQSSQVERLLYECTFLNMMWDESDSYAKDVVDKANGLYCYVGTNKVLIKFGHGGVPREVAYLAKSNVTDWHFESYCYSTQTIDLSFLGKLRLERLVLDGVKPTTWEFCNTKSLKVDTSIELAFPQLCGVEDLELSETGWVCSTAKESWVNWQGLQSFPNVTTLRVNGNLSVRNAQELVLELADMFEIRTFCFTGAAPRAFLGDLQRVPHLTCVSVRLCGLDGDYDDRTCWSMFEYVAFWTIIVVVFYFNNQGL